MSQSIVVRNKLYQTFPLIHHCPLDRPHQIWHDLVRICGKSSKSICKPGDLTIITFNNTDEKMLLEHRLCNSQTDHVVLGKGLSEWKNPLKIQLLAEYLPSVKTDFVLVMDACDVIISSDLLGLIGKFLEFRCKVLYNASSFIYPYETHYSFLERNITQDLFGYFNSGCFIGFTDYCRELYRQVNSYEDETTMAHAYSDQIKLKPFYLQEYPKIKIDSGCKLFQIWNINRLVKDYVCEDILDICCKFL